MKTLLKALFALALLLSFPAFPLEITYSSVNPFDGSSSAREGLLLKGEITPGDYEYLLDVIRSDAGRFWRSIGVVLASPGGDVQEALKVASLVKGTYRAVFVGRSSGPCISACFLVFASAARRAAVPPMLGIHRPYISPRRLISLSPNQAETLQNDLLRNARVHLEDLHVPRNLIDTMFQRASTEVYWLSREEIEQLGLRPPWFEQFLIARCGLDKSLEQKYFATNDAALLPRILEVDLCGERLSRPDGETFLRTELRKSPKH